MAVILTQLLSVIQIYFLTKFLKIMKAKLILFLTFLVFNPIFAQRIITGKVTEASNGEALIGANVSLYNGQKVITSVTTDIDGLYRVIISVEATEIGVNYVGYIPMRQKIDSSKVVNFALKEDGKVLGECVVVGYSTHTKGNMKSLTPGVASQDGDGDPRRKGKPSMSVKSKQKKSTATFIKPGEKDHDDIKDKNPRSEGEGYNPIEENAFKNVSHDPLSTFSIDVDRASYSNVRSYINGNQMPPKDAIRTEELVNYFDYEYPQPKGDDPLAIFTEVCESPFNQGLQLLHIGMQSKALPVEDLPASNLVFLIDVSGSMSDENKLPLLKKAFILLTENLRGKDKISIVVYAGSSGLVLPPTSGNDKKTILAALDKLESGGSTAGGEGIELAYKTAMENYLKEGNNRVILATDGDFNVGVNNPADLKNLIEGKRKTGVFLSVLGFGMGNYKDNNLEMLANKGNGNYAYIDNLLEAKKTLVKEFGSTLFTVAKDVKLQLEFNPAFVKGYRLMGYENRLLNNEDFKDDTKDAGELGSGHVVTAIYEIIPTSLQKSEYLKEADMLKYQKVVKIDNASNELLTVKIRCKKPNENKSKEMQYAVENKVIPFEKASENVKLSASVAEFSMLLRDSKYKGTSSFEHLIKTTQQTLTNDKEGYRHDFLQMVKTAELLKKTDMGAK
jgi:Ca-activated chloride channel homolog